MGAARLSVVVVSTGRPDALARCLTGLHQMPRTDVEVIVVADAAGLEAANGLPFSDRLTVLGQERQNIATARNEGIAAAAGEIVAFIDDDSVPEPTWADALIAGFAEPSVAAVTGSVIGRNGISLQWGHMAVDRLGRDRWVNDGLGDDEVLKLHGTNMAFRRAVLARIGGFDPAFSFYLEDTDMARRLGNEGEKTVFLPGAVVHHGFAASPRRTKDRVPTDLFDIGASTEVFLRKHAPATDRAAALVAMEEDQRARLLRLARARKIGAREIRRLMESLAAGIADGARRTPDPPRIPEPRRGFLPLRDELPGAMRVLHGWRFRASRLRAEAARLVASGHPVSLFLFEPTPRKHKVRFTEGGWWEQIGGLFGPADRDDLRLRPWLFRSRLAAEKARVAAVRGLM